MGAEYLFMSGLINTCGISFTVLDTTVTGAEETTIPASGKSALTLNLKRHVSDMKGGN